MTFGGGSLVAKTCLTLVTPCTVARQAPLSLGFPRQEYWCGLPFPSLGDLPDPGIEAESPILQADSLLLSHQGRPTVCGVTKRVGQDSWSDQTTTMPSTALGYSSCPL